MKFVMPKIKMPQVKVPVQLSRAIGRMQLTLKRNDSAIMTGVGIAGMLGTVVLACRATAKMPELVSDHERLLKNLHDMEASVDAGEEIYVQDENGADITPMTENDIRHEKVQIYAFIAKDYIRTYLPAVALGMASTGCIVYGHTLEHRKYLGAVEAYTGAMGLLDAYRERVKEKYGEDVDKELRYGLKHDILEGETVNENGKKKKTKEDILTLDGGEPGQYARVFDERNHYWEKSPEFTMMFLKAQQNKFQHLLNTRGYVFLNEVYDALGFEMTSTGGLVGWLQNPEDQPTNYISFGLFDYDNPKTRLFINGKTNAVLLDFNVDGVIIDRLPA